MRLVELVLHQANPKVFRKRRGSFAGRSFGKLRLQLVAGRAIAG